MFVPDICIDSVHANACIAFVFFASCFECVILTFLKIFNFPILIFMLF